MGSSFSTSAMMKFLAIALLLTIFAYQTGAKHFLVETAGSGNERIIEPEYETKQGANPGTDYEYEVVERNGVMYEQVPRFGVMYERVERDGKMYDAACIREQDAEDFIDHENTLFGVQCPPLED